MTDSAPSVPPSEPHRPTPAAPSWNPLATPVAWIVILVPIGLYVAASKMSDWRFNTVDAIAVQKLGALNFWNGDDAPWRWVATLFLHGMLLNLIISVSLLWSLAPALEKQLRTWRFTLLYVLGGLGAEFTRQLLKAYVTGHVATDAGNGGRCAAFALLGSIAGVYLGFGAVRQAIWAVLQRVGYYAVMILLMALLSPQLEKSFGVGIDLWGALSDMGIGAICGLAIALTLHKGGRKIAGFALVALLVASVGVEAGWVHGLAKANGIPDRKEAPVVGHGSKNHHKVDETTSPDFRPSPTPSPITSMPDEDPPEIAEIRAKAHVVLDPLGPLPGPSPDGDLRASVRTLAAELSDFDKHWTKNASANLDLEIGQLYLLDHELVSADRAADAARAMLVNPRPKRGTPGARRLAQALGTLGLVALEQKKSVDARELFGRATEADPTLPEPHFYLGKLLPDPERRKLELKAFVDLAGAKPPPSQADLLPEAKELLGS